MNNLGSKLYNELYEFLSECRTNDWELDSDDISHILAGDFDYIRKQHIIEGVQHG